ncbi:MAG: hypothetical protein Q8N28_00045 [bacterium]|nr:hypothetical protein [bacterium]
MKYTFSFKDFSWKRVGLGILIGMGIFFLILLSIWYFVDYRPIQELLKESKRMDEAAREYYAKKGLPLPDFLKTTQ